MAEFSEVMKQLARMVNACNGKCDECRLDNSEFCIEPLCSGNTEGIAEAERIVMQWAAENPEPVYPTWGGWLAEACGAPNTITFSNSPLAEHDGVSPETYVQWMVTHRVPADIAEKLGIEPKEVDQ